MFSYSNALGRDRKKLGRTIAAVLMASLIISACDEQTNPDQFLTRAQEYRDKGDLRASIIEAKNALRIRRDDQDARYILGSNYLDLGDWPSAETTLETALAQGGTLEYAIIPLLSRAKLQLGKSNDVLKIAGIRSDMNDELKARILIVRGRAHSGLRNYTEAKKAFDTALAADPDAFGAYLGMAGLAIGQGDHAKGRDLLAKAVKIEPENIDVLEFQARYRFSQKDFDSAQKFYRTLISKRPTRVAFHAGVIRAMIAADKHEEATKTLEPLLKKSPNNFRLNFLRALVAFRSQDYVTAFDSSNKVLSIVKDHPPSLLIAGASAYANTQYEQAAQFLQHYVQRHPDQIQARIMLGEVQLRLNQVGDAQKNLESAAKKRPENVALLLAIGRASSMAGDLQKSSDFFQRAVKLRPESNRVRAAFGVSQIALGRTEEGISELEKAVQNDTRLQNAEISLILNLARQKRFDEALTATKRLIERHPDRAIGHTITGLLQFSKGDVAKAGTSFKAALKLNPKAADAAANLASIALTSNKAAEARDILLKVIKHNPRDYRLIGLLANAQMRLGDVEGAVKSFERNLEIRPEDLKSRTKLAQLLLLSGRAKKAYLAAKGGPAALQTEPGILEVLGQAQTILGLHADAIETFNSLVRARPKSADAKFHLGKSYVAASKMVDAQKALEGALALDPEHNRSRTMLADVLLRQNKIEEASVKLDELLSEAPELPAYLILKGRLALQRGKPEEAIKPLRRASRSVENPVLISLLAMAESRAKGRGVGLETLRKWLKKHPKDVKIRFQLANNFMIFNQHKEAEKEFRFLVGLQPKNWIFLNNLADVLTKLDKPDEALPYAERAYKLVPTQPAILDTYGVILLDNGKYDEAVEILSAAARRAPDSPEIAFNAARAFERVGKIDEARTILKGIVPGDKPFRSRKAAEKLLKKLGG